MISQIRKSLLSHSKPIAIAILNRGGVSEIALHCHRIITVSSLILHCFTDWKRTGTPLLNALIVDLKVTRKSLNPHGDQHPNEIATTLGYHSDITRIPLGHHFPSKATRSALRSTSKRHGFDTRISLEYHSDITFPRTPPDPHCNRHPNNTVSTLGYHSNITLLETTHHVYWI